MTGKSPAWLLLVTNLPGRNPTLRMRLWRALKAAGAGLLRDGVYILPNSDPSRRVLEDQAQQIQTGGGQAQILALDAESPEQNSELVMLFDRTAEYQGAIRSLDAFKRGLGKLREQQARQRLTTLGREVSAVVARDFFPTESRAQIGSAMADAEAALNARFSPDEPHPTRQKMRLRDRAAYRGRTWATRERLWIDRVASAWLIRRFIDPGAQFVWLKSVKDCPKRAIGFDFDGAEFSHVGNKVTFEVLVASFGLEQDPGLQRIGELVHHLDVGGIPTAEGPGFAAIMNGARKLQPDDNALLDTITPVLNSLYATYAAD